MARALEEIARRDRRWFRAHPERSHRCRWPDPDELDFCDGDLGCRLVIAIRHLGRGRIVYQPVIFEGALPRDERTAATLFALALWDLHGDPGRGRQSTRGAPGRNIHHAQARRSGRCHAGPECRRHGRPRAPKMRSVSLLAIFSLVADAGRFSPSCSRTNARPSLRQLGRWSGPRTAISPIG